MSQVRVTIRDLVARSAQTHNTVMLVVPDKHGLYARDVLSPAENERAYIAGSRVRIHYHNDQRTSPDPTGIAEIDLVVDPEKGAPAFAVAAAIERKTGAEATVVESHAFIRQPLGENDPLLFPIGAWRQRWTEGQFPKRCIAFSVEASMPPHIHFGPVQTVQAIELPDRSIVQVPPLFELQPLRKAIEPRAMYLESRIAWLLHGMGSNIEDVCSQVVNLTSGRQRRICEIVARVPDVISRVGIEHRLNVLCAIFNYWRTDIDDLDRSDD
ncbi:MAG: hypothetical protein IT435_11535 [Phycisphaerales bacterium]|nr:hypothetical protein [Phycisphaerales bacterium]